MDRATKVTLERNNIDLNEYRGIRDQDGYEVLELTLRTEKPQGIAEAILRALKED